MSQPPRTLQLIPGFIKFWFFLSAIIVFFDAAFVILRPETQKGGSLYQIFHPYEHYIYYDTLYGDLNDSFVVIQSWLNIVEGIALLIAVALSLSSKVSTQLWSALIGVITSTCVFWKTVIFIWYDKDWTTQDAKNFTPGSILCYWFPSSLWIIFPLLAMILIPKRIVNYVSTTGEITPKQKNQWKWSAYICLFSQIFIVAYHQINHFSATFC